MKLGSTCKFLATFISLAFFTWGNCQPDTLILINGQELPCDILVESLHDVKVRFTQEQLIEAYDRKFRFHHYAIRSLHDHGNQRKIKLGKVVLVLSASDSRSAYKFHSIDTASVTVITTKYKDSNGYRKYSLESIPAQELEMIRWKNDKTAIGAAVGVISGAVAAVLIFETTEFGDTGDRIGGALMLGSIGGAVGAVIGIAITDRVKIEHNGDLKEWQEHFENIPLKKTSTAHN